MSAIEPRFVYVVLDFNGSVIGAGVSRIKARSHAASYLGVSRSSLPEGLGVLRMNRQALKKRLSRLGVDASMEHLLFME